MYTNNRPKNHTKFVVDVCFYTLIFYWLLSWMMTYLIREYHLIINIESYWYHIKDTVIILNIGILNLYHTSLKIRTSPLYYHLMWWETAECVPNSTDWSDTVSWGIKGCSSLSVPILRLNTALLQSGRSSKKIKNKIKSFFILVTLTDDKRMIFLVIGLNISAKT